jgi:hypothetical protein
MTGTFIITNVMIKNKLLQLSSVRLDINGIKTPSKVFFSEEN